MHNLPKLSIFGIQACLLRSCLSLLLPSLLYLESFLRLTSIPWSSEVLILHRFGVVWYLKALQTSSFHSYMICCQMVNMADYIICCHKQS